MHHDHRIAGTTLCRDHVFRIDLADSVLLSFNGLDMAAGIDPASFGEDERSVVIFLIVHCSARATMPVEVRPTGIISARACRAARSPLRRAASCYPPGSGGRLAPFRS